MKSKYKVKQKVWVVHKNTLGTNVRCPYCNGKGKVKAKIKDIDFVTDCPVCGLDDGFLPTPVWVLADKGPKEIIGIAQILENGKIVTRYKLKNYYSDQFLRTENELFATEKDALNYIAKFNKKSLNIAIKKRKQEILKENKEKSKYDIYSY